MGKFLVTGATGFLGSHLTVHLLRAGYAVKAMRRKNSRMSEFDYILSVYKLQPSDFKDTLEWIEGDLTDPTSLELALSGVEKVFHCGGLVSFHDKDRDRLFEVNTQGTESLVNACLSLGITDFFHVSSTAAIGKGATGEISNEETEWKKEDHPSPYHQSKYLAEMEVWRGAEEGLSVCIINPSIILGPGIWKRGTCRLFYNVYNRFPFYSTGTQAFVDVRDVCEAIIFLHEKQISGQRFLLHGHVKSFKELFFHIADLAGKRRPWIKIGPLASGLAWRIFAIWEKITGKRSMITRHSARSSVGNASFSSQKIELLGFKTRAHEETLGYTTQELLAYYKAGKPHGSLPAS